MRVTGLAALLTATLVWSAVSFGAVYPWAYWPLAVASAALGVWGLLATRTDPERGRATLSVVLGAVLVAGSLQLVPLPHSWLDGLSPGVNRFLGNLILAYRPPAAHALSINPGDTAVALALFTAFLLLLVGLVRGLRLISPRRLASIFTALGLGLALLGIVQAPMLDRSQPLVYGFWRPLPGATPFGPFINKNHFAGWMVMVLPIALGGLIATLARARASGRRRMGHVAFGATSVLIMTLAVVLTGSRSGMVSLAVAFGVIGVSLWRGTETRPAAGLMNAGLLALGVAALVWGGPGATVARFAESAGAFSGRWHAWHDTTRIIDDFRVFGTGLGTYAETMLVYQTGDRTAMYEQAHNDYLQVVAEGGLLVAIPALIALGIIVATILRRLRAGDEDVRARWLRVGAAAGLMGIAVQSVVEFTLQMPGNTATFVVLLAMALQRPYRKSPHANRV